MPVTESEKVPGKSRSKEDRRRASIRRPSGLYTTDSKKRSAVVCHLQDCLEGMLQGYFLCALVHATYSNEKVGSYCQSGSFWVARGAKNWHDALVSYRLLLSPLGQKLIVLDVIEPGQTSMSFSLKTLADEETQCTVFVSRPVIYVVC